MNNTYKRLCLIYPCLYILCRRMSSMAAHLPAYTCLPHASPSPTSREDRRTGLLGLNRTTWTFSNYKHVGRRQEWEGVGMAWRGRQHCWVWNRRLKNICLGMAWLHAAYVSPHTYLLLSMPASVVHPVSSNSSLSPMSSLLILPFIGGVETCRLIWAGRAKPGVVTSSSLQQTPL